MGLGELTVGPSRPSILRWLCLVLVFLQPPLVAGLDLSPRHAEARGLPGAKPWSRKGPAAIHPSPFVQGAPPSIPSPRSPDPAAAQARLQALTRLARQRWAIPGERLRIEGDPQWGRLSKAGGILSAPSGAEPERIARQFLQAHADLFRFAQGDVSDLEIYWRRESLGGTHLHFKQLHRGLVIHGASLSIHIDREGRVRQVSNHSLPEIRDPIETSAGGPTLAQEAALARAWEHLGVRGALRGEPWAGQVIYPQGESARLAWQVSLPARHPLGDWLVLVDARTGEILEVKNLLKHLSGKGRVFDPNPVVTLKDRDGLLSDQEDRREAVPEEAYFPVTLEGLDGSGFLKGLYVDTVKTPQRVRRPNLDFSCYRDEACFEEGMAYYHIDRYQRYLQSLGFAGQKAILARPQWVNARDLTDEDPRDGEPDDNSFFSPTTGVIHYGIGGVDDAEDAEIILHEYGHALQEDQVPGFAGENGEGGALGEGFGDYIAASFLARGSFDEACVGDWDARGGDPPQPCVRRVDDNKHYPEDFVFEVHADGEIWSAALWELRRTLGPEAADRLVLEANFSLDPHAGFREGAEAVLQADAILNSGAHQGVIRAIFEKRGLLLPPDAFEENDSSEEAWPIALPFDRPDLTIESPRAEDFYRLSLDQPATLEIRLVFPSQTDDLKAFLLDAQGEMLRSSVSSGDTGRLMAYNLSPGTYLIRVKGQFANSINAYSLQVTPAALLFPDAFEENDSPQEASPIALPFEGDELTLEALGERDCYRLFLEKAGPLMIWLGFSPEGGELDLLLLDETGRPMGSPGSSPEGKRLFLPGLAPGSYTIQVTSPSGMAHRYTLAAFTPLGPPAPDRFEENNDEDRATPLDLPFIAHDLNLHMEGDVDFYRFSLDQAQIVEIDLTFLHAEGNLDLELRDSRGGLLRIASSLDDHERLRIRLSPGSYIFKVFGVQGATNAYRLRVTISPPLSPDPLEENDSREGAAPIGLPFDRHDLTIDSPGDEDFYRLVLDRPATVVALLLSPSIEGDLDLYLWDSQGEVIKSATSEGDLERLTALDLPEGQYFLQVVGFGQDTNPYELTLFLADDNETDPPLPDLRLSADRLEFGELKVGNHADLPLTLTNEGPGTLRVSRIQVDSPDFSLLSPPAPFSLGPGESQEILVRFSPLSWGPQSGTLTLTSNDLDRRTATVALSGSTPALVVLQEGAEYARKPRVSLRLLLPPTAVQMRFSNDRTRWSPWMKSATVAAWNLSAGEGLKTVWAQFRNAEGLASEAGSDTIRLDIRPPQGEIRINGDDPSVPAGVPVSLTLQAQDSGSGLSQMMVSNAPNFLGSPWEDYVPEKSWSLKPGKGVRTVFVRYRDHAGNLSQTFKDSIRVVENP
ncbi:MAG: choice-of-anchor D domain-containing protein [Candidatus Tectomicrobia bacterium]|uniref:Choice-of-anchor D domain-containing protein n=1 Tax=Tectimicrobiota bacterium TaxID=2528274 RepID=A0A932CNP4_UNCTE|nr:choice-of-anchor D domain-containing protein [Candidatus Tectomicrobia bacterium]